MSSRYIARRYGAGASDAYGGGVCSSFATSSPDRSRAVSRASIARTLESASASISRSTSRSRGPSMAPSSRGGSPTPSYYGSGGQTNPYPSRASTPLTSQRTASATSYSSEYYMRSRRSASPLRTHYTDILCAASKRLRQRSIPPPPPLPEKLEPLRPPGKPPLPPRVVASDFYRGKVKSIYEREPLFNDFCRTIPQRYGNINIYNTGTLDTIKTDFKAMVEDKWSRKTKEDPSVEANFGTKAYPWRNMMVKPNEPASARLIRVHNERARATTPVSMPKVYVYHRSTLSWQGTLELHRDQVWQQPEPIWVEVKNTRGHHRSLAAEDINLG